MSDARILAYEELLGSFVTGSITADQFEQMFLSRFKGDPAPLGDKYFPILGELFTDVDAYCGDPSLRGPNDIDEETLRSAASRALQRLRKVKQT